VRHLIKYKAYRTNPSPYTWELSSPFALWNLEMQHASELPAGTRPNSRGSRRTHRKQQHEERETLEEEILIGRLSVRSRAKKCLRAASYPDSRPVSPTHFVLGHEGAGKMLYDIWAFDVRSK